MKHHARIGLVAVTVVAVTAPVTACSGIGAADPYAEKAQSAPATAAAPASSSSSSGTGAGRSDAGSGGGAKTDDAVQPAPRFALYATQTKALGWVVADGKGWILYRFDKDKGMPHPTSTCNGACAHKWPPVLWHGKPALKGVSPSIVGKVERADGTWQLTLHGWPVYRFAGDTRPGDWKGQGVGRTWHTIMRTGARNLAKPAAAPVADDSTPTITDPYGNSSNY
jgi:predicted lipoprotein with Yx(FWY)xxD motif